MVSVATAKSKQQLSQVSGGFLAIPRELFRLCWAHLRLKEIAFLLALIDLADGRWTTPIALAEIAKIARLSAGGARETAAHLERAGLVARQPAGSPGVYRWRVASGDYLSIARSLAHRPRLKVKPRPAQLEIFDSPEVPPMNRSSLSMILPPAGPPAPLEASRPAPRPAEPPPVEAPETPEAPPTVPAPPPAPDTERDIYLYPPELSAESAGAPPVPELAGPETMTPLGSLAQIVRLAAQPFPDEAPPQIGTPPRPKSGRSPAPDRDAPPPQIGAPPRPKSGRPHLMISKPSPKTEPNPTQTSAHARDGGTGEGCWSSEERARLVALACSLAPGLAPGYALARLGVLEGEGQAPAVVAAFLEREIPAAAARGATHPFGAALARWVPPPPAAPPPAPVLLPEASPPPVRAPGHAVRAPMVPEQQRILNLQGARAALQALSRRNPAATRPSLEKP